MQKNFIYLFYLLEVRFKFKMLAQCANFSAVGAVWDIIVDAETLMQRENMDGK